MVGIEKTLSFKVLDRRKKHQRGLNLFKNNQQKVSFYLKN